MKKKINEYQKINIWSALNEIYYPEEDNYDSMVKGSGLFDMTSVFAHDTFPAVHAINMQSGYNNNNKTPKQNHKICSWTDISTLNR